MVADLDRYRNVERGDPVDRGIEFAVPRAHRQVTGDRHRIGAALGDLLLHPVERDVVL